MSDLPVAGYCPMGCGTTLVRRETGFINCSNPGCLEPNAVFIILGDSESEHIVEFRDDGFTIRHPLRERIDEALFECRYQQELAESLAGPPVPPGTYRVTRKPGGEEWAYEWVEREALNGRQ